MVTHLVVTPLSATFHFRRNGIAKLKEAKVKMELQPKLKEAHNQGYATCKRAIVNMREFMKPA